MKYTLRPYQKQASDAAVKAFLSKRKQNGIIVLPTGCHAKGSKILMYDGTQRNVEDVKVGDLLVGNDGTPRTVLELHHGYDKMYRVTPIKGEPFVVNGGHILALYKTNEGKDYESCKPRYDEISVSEYIGKSKNYKHLHKLYKPQFVDFGTVDNPDTVPYFVGLFLGDGSSSKNTISITSQRKEVEDYLVDLARRCEMKLRKYTKKDNLASSYFFVNHHPSATKPNPIAQFIESIGLLHCKAADKFIPLRYKTASKKDRLELLAGLLDTDAYYDQGKNSFEYCTKSPMLAEDMIFLCRSLGFYCGSKSEKIVNGETYYRMSISGELHEIPTKVGIRRGRPRQQKKSTLVTGFTVEFVGYGEYFGFTIDGNHLYCDGQFFVHHNSGKSLVIADIASKIDEPLLVFQPSKEILEQNFSKLQSYGIWDCGVYSASVGYKDIRRITFATIGSVMNHMDDFSHFKKVLIDECHTVNGKGGQYKEFIKSEDRQVVGLTATPYRLSKGFDGMSMLKFLTRTRPRVFTSVLYYCQISELLSKGYLADLQYYDLTCIDLRNVRANSTGADYDEESLKQEYVRSGFYDKLTTTTLRVLKPKNGIPRKGVLVFTRFIQEADDLVRNLSMAGITAKIVTGETPKKERESILESFKKGAIKVVANVGTLTTGFDYPELDTVIIGRPTKSLALYYQICVDDETEILTRRGWTSCNDMQYDDIVAAYKNGEIIWTNIQQITKREVYTGEVMVSAENPYINFNVTGEHDLLVRARGAACDFFKQKAIDVASKRRGLFEMPVSGIENVNGNNLTDDEIRFFGWVVSDGSWSKQNNTIHIVQSNVNKDNIEEIERVLKSCKLKYGKVLAKRKGKQSKYADTYHFYISYGHPRKKEDRDKGLTGWRKYEQYINGCKKWSNSFEYFTCHQFDVFVETLDKADGSHTKAIDYVKHTKSICCGISKEYCDRLQSLAVRRGWRACQTVYNRENNKCLYILRLLKVDKATIAGVGYDLKSNRTRLKVSRPAEEQIVWCVKNEIGTIVTRRRGKVVIMGNCGRAIRPHKGKDGWIIDLGGSYRRFGKVSDLRISCPANSEKWVITSNGKQLTNISF